MFSASYDKMKDDIAVGYPYVVVQFLQLPYADIDDHSCVPHSWIRGRRATDRKILILYPDEPPSITKMRIINNDKPSEKWKLYMAIIKLESHSYEDACEFIMGKIHNASRNRYSDIMRIGYNLSPPTTTKRYSPLLRTNKLSDPQSKKNRSRLKVVDKAKLKDINLNSRKLPEYFNVESRTPSLLELPGFVSSENTVIKENCKKEHQDQTSRDFRPSSNHLLLRYPYTQQKPEEDKGIQVNSPGAGYRRTGKTLYASKCPLTLVNQICDYTLKPEENQLLSIHREHLHQIALTQGIQNSKISNLRTFTLDFPEPLIQNPHMGSNTSFIIQNPTNEANQFSQLEIPKSLPVIHEHPQVLPKQKIPDHLPEVECTTSELTAHSKVTNISHASITCTNLSEHQDSIEEDMVVDELAEVSCIEPNDLSGTSAENECSANPKAPEEANYSGQTIDSSMEEGSPMIEAVTSSGISSTQNVDHDEHSHSSDLSPDEILTTFTNSNEQAYQSVISISNQVDIWADQLFELFQNMKIDFSETCQIAHNLHESSVQSQKVIEYIANVSENLRTLKKDEVAVVTSKEVTAEVQQIIEKNQAKKKEEENPNVSMDKDKKRDNDVDSKSSENNDECGGDIKNVKDQDRGNKVPKKTRDHIRTFVLPPEYDPYDTRWTLKYRKNDPKLNLVELVPGSSVFINSLKLAHCKLAAKNSKELARMLLREIFSQSALSVCSLTGVRANAFDISGTNVRPGLDEKARITILSFVKEHALEKKWGPFDPQSVINSLRSKIQDLRAKHAETA